MADEIAVQEAPQTVIERQSPSTPELGSQTPVADKPAAEPKADKPAVQKSVADAVRDADERVKAREAEKAKEKPGPKVETTRADEKPEVKAERERSQDGKFSPKNSAEADRAVQENKGGDQTSEGRKPHHDAPARFNENSKRDWANAPESVKEDIHRVISENEKGIQKYKDNSDRWDKIREYDDEARKSGREGIHQSLKEITEFESLLKQNPIAGFQKVADAYGYDLHKIAAHITGQNPDQQVAQARQEVSALKAEIQRMKEESQAPKIVEDFFGQHEDARGMSDDLAFLLEKGYIPSGSLEDAYEFAKRFKPASNAGNSQPLIPAESATAHTQAPALNPAGSKSVSGAPTGGVSPSQKVSPSGSPLEAVRRAAARLG